jgi:osmoprotectant transport system ATP-binding protein
VTKRYPGSEVPAVDGLSLSIAAGELVVLVGPSGCGKTTTLRMLNALEQPTSGQILVGGVDAQGRRPHELRREMGYVIQGVGLFPHRTVAQNIATVPRLLGWDKHRVAARVRELVELVDLDPDLLGRYPASLSGGQQQRVGVARALAADPPVLLMDEPYSAVDPIVRAHLQDELIALHRRVGTTIVLVTHDIDEALKVGDRIAVLAVGGRLAQYAPPVELLADPADDFVRQFVGGRRSLRRLALVPLADLRPLFEPVGVGPRPADVPSVDLHATAADALEIILATGSAAVEVTVGGEPVGCVSFDMLSGSARTDVSVADLPG